MTTETLRTQRNWFEEKLPFSVISVSLWSGLVLVTASRAVLLTRRIFSRREDFFESLRYRLTLVATAYAAAFFVHRCSPRPSRGLSCPTRLRASGRRPLLRLLASKGIGNT